MKRTQKMDPTLAMLLKREWERQESEINLIASENYTSPAVMAASASVLTNKYAEGYPGKRYYAGCEVVDIVEDLARERCKKLFGAEHVNVQPHAGSQANAAVYHAALKPGDTILGMSLATGGHLTHGHTVNFSGTHYNAVQYSLDPVTEQLDYNQIAQLADKHKPKLLIAGASAYSRFIDFEKLKAIADSVGALFLADIAHIAGLVATGLHPSPMKHADFVTSTTHKTLRGPRGGLIMSTREQANAVDKAIMPGTQGGPFMHIIAAKAAAFHEALQPDFKTYQKQIIVNAQTMSNTFKSLGYRIVSGGTDNHLFVVDLRSQGLTGLEAEKALGRAGITISRSCIPFDTQKPWITSGMRIGTPAITSRGMREPEIEEITQLIGEVLAAPTDMHRTHRIAQRVKALCAQYPIYNDEQVTLWPPSRNPVQKTI